MFFYVTPKGIGVEVPNSFKSRNPRVTIEVEGETDLSFRAYCGSAGISLHRVNQKSGPIEVTEFGSNLNFLVERCFIPGPSGVTVIITGGTPGIKDPLAGVFTTETDLTEVQIFRYLLQTLKIEISKRLGFESDLESLVKVLTHHIARLTGKPS